VLYTLIPASVTVGAGKTLFWMNSQPMNVYFAKLFEAQDKKRFNKYFSILTGIYVGAYLSCQVHQRIVYIHMWSI